MAPALESSIGRGEVMGDGLGSEPEDGGEVLERALSEWEGTGKGISRKRD